MKEITPINPVEDAEQGLNHRLELAQKSIEQTGLADDTKNCWNSIGTLRPFVGDRGDSEMLNIILPKALQEPVQTYAEYVSQHHPDLEIQTYILECSSADKVQRFDELVAQANAIRTGILELDSTEPAAGEADESTGIVDPDQEDPKIGMLRDLLEVQRQAMLLIGGGIS